MKRLVYILCFFSLTSAGQALFTNVRSAIEAGEGLTQLAVLDSIQRNGKCLDSCYFYKCLVFIKDDKLKEAKNQLKYLLKSYPDFYLADYLQALIMFSQEDYARSISALNKVLMKDSANYKALYNRALISGLLEDYKAATQDLSACIKISPRNPQAYYSRAYWSEMSGQLNEAIGDYETTIKLSPRNFDAYIGLANIYHLQKNVQKACEAISSAVEAGSQIAVEIRENYCH